jgi:hypothetical protein
VSEETNNARLIDLGDDFGDVVAKAETAPQIGDLDEGGIYVGKSATTGQDLHAVLKDEPQYLNFYEALAAAEEMRKRPGRENAHVPMPEELDVNLYRNKDKGKLLGTFKISTGGMDDDNCCYRSSAVYGDDSARVQWFVGGTRHFKHRNARLPVRLVW